MDPAMRDSAFGHPTSHVGGGFLLLTLPGGSIRDREVEGTG
jgi:hypothetical protein